MLHSLLMMETGTNYNDSDLKEHNDFVHTDTDVDLCIKIFFNPKQWLTRSPLTFFWDDLNGYGFRLLFLYVAVYITKRGYFKNQIDTHSEDHY